MEIKEEVTWNEFTDRTCGKCGRVLPKRAEKMKFPVFCKDFNLECIEWEKLPKNVNIVE